MAENMSMYEMTRGDNADYARQNIAESIWNQLQLEGYGGISPQDVQDVCNGMPAPWLNGEESALIANLERAWNHVLDTLGTECDLEYISNLNSIVGNGIVPDAGKPYFRSDGTGTDERGPIATSPQTADGFFLETQSRESLDACLDMFAALYNANLYPCGNGMTAQLVANKMMIERGMGLLSVPGELKAMLELELERSRVTGVADQLRAMLIDTSISGYDSPSLTGSGSAATPDKPVWSQNIEYSRQMQLLERLGR